MDVTLESTLLDWAVQSQTARADGNEDCGTSRQKRDGDNGVAVQNCVEVRVTAIAFIHESVWHVVCLLLKPYFCNWTSGVASSEDAAAMTAA